MKKKKYHIAGGPSRYLFLLPGGLVYFLIILLPAFYSLYLSFFKWNGADRNKEFVGIDNYVNLIVNDPVFKRALVNNTIWIVLTVCAVVPVALLFAVLINQKFKGRTVVRGILYFPSILSGITVAITWNWVYHPQLGLYNNFVKLIGQPELAKAWLADSKTAFFAIFLAGFWHIIGLPMILFLSGLQTIPSDILEAASIDGASRLQRFFRVTIPMLRETFIIVLANQLIQSLKVYDIITGMTAGGPANSTQTLATWMVTQTYTFNNVGTGTAIAWVMVLVCMLIVIPYVMFMTRE